MRRQPAADDTAGDQRHGDGCRHEDRRRPPDGGRGIAPGGRDDRTTQLAGGRVSVVFQLQESTALTLIGPRDAADETAARKAEETELQARLSRLQSELAAMSKRLGDKHPAVASTGAEIENIKMRLAAFDSGDVRPRAIPLGGRSVIDTTFSMEIGETVVVGTSRMRGGDKALIALLTAVPRGGVTTRKE